jgi:predicted membrane channel-forming protein YqfA (hemolysin III family)
MILLASFSDGLSFGVTLILSVSVPTVGLIVSGVTMNKHGLNPWSGSASIAFFIALLIGSVMWVLDGRQGMDQRVVLYALLGCVAVHSLSGLMALRGLAQVRLKRKWTHGKRRAFWMVWMNVVVIFIIGAWCYYHVNPRFHDAFAPPQ